MLLSLIVLGHKQAVRLRRLKVYGNINRLVAELKPISGCVDCSCPREQSIAFLIFPGRTSSDPLLSVGGGHFGRRRIYASIGHSSGSLAGKMSNAIDCS